LLCKAQKYINIEDVVLAKEMKGKGREAKEQTTIGIRRRDTKRWIDRREKEGAYG